MYTIRFRGQLDRKLVSDPVPVLPDGKEARLPVDDTCYLKHNRNSFGWPANQVQQYLNTENEALRQMMVQQMQFHNVGSDGMSQLSPAQRCALTPNRRSQTMSEFMSDQSRLDGVRDSLFPRQEPNDPDPDDKTIKFNNDDSAS